MRPGRITLQCDRIMEAAQSALGFVEGLDIDAFKKDNRTYMAVAMNLLIIGEAVSSLARKHADFLQVHTEVPWDAMRGMRNRIAHGYHHLNPATVWEIVTEAVPAMITAMPAVRADAVEEDNKTPWPKPTYGT